jgi:sterol desaturase/sphingolipid hydroxylase (fatty acid hydroxylase superfamily)
MTSSTTTSSIFDRYPILNGIGGLSHGSFFRIQDELSVKVQKEQERGQGRQGQGQGQGGRPAAEKEDPSSLPSQLYKIMIGKSFVYSPNLTWLIMAVCVWCIVPYNLDSDVNTNVNVVQLQDVILDRIYINYLLALSYITFWHCALYYWGYCNHPFVPNRIYNIHKVLHNIFYTVLGIFQWTIVEGMFIYLYKSNKLPYCTMSTNDNNNNIDWNILLQTLLLSILVPSYRDFHFYFTHRFIHIRCLYKYIHSVHHRNTDIEPFAGLAMHPIEHLYYFTWYVIFLLFVFTDNYCVIGRHNLLFCKTKFLLTIMHFSRFHFRFSFFKLWSIISTANIITIQITSISIILDGNACYNNTSCIPFWL